MSPLALAGIIFLALLILLATGLPIGFSLGFMGVIGLIIVGETQALSNVALTVVHYGTAWVLITLPLFILMSELLVFTEAGADAFEVAHKWLTRLPGGLAVASVAACGVFAAASGSSTGTAAAIGIVSVPEMLKRGYSKSLATGATAAGGTLGILIPPSSIMIIYAILTDQPIADLFIAGVMPGIMLVFLFAISIIVRVKLNPSLAPPMPGVSWRERFGSIYRIWAIVVIILFVMVGLYTGIATPTEIAAVGSLGALLVAIIRRKLTWQNLKGALLQTVRVSCFVYFIIFGAMIFGNFLSVQYIPQAISAAVTSLAVSPIVVLIIIQLLLIFLGMFLDPASMLVLTMPIIFPIITFFGFDPIWFGVVVTINMEMGNITPPVGLNLFVIKSIAPDEVTLGDVIRGIVPFFAMQVLGMALVIIFPQIALWLPSKMLG